MDPIKEAFTRIKEDINTLREEINKLKYTLNSIQNSQISTQNPTENTYPTHQQTDNPTQNCPLEAHKSQNSTFSIGNRGVPTNKPTDRQTIQHPFISSGNPQNQPFQVHSDALADFQRAKEALESLDNVKKNIRSKFKRLTSQEMAVFSVLYALEEQNFDQITYNMIAKTLNLSESSIRDYINRLIKKNVPIHKIKENNKKIVLKISHELKNTASLDTIMRLRDL